MRLSTNLLGIVVLSTAFGTAHALEVPTPTPAVLAQRTAIQHDKLRHLIQAHLDTQTTFQNQHKHLKDAYGDVEFTNVYQHIDLATMGGIHTVRERLTRLDAKTKGFAAAQKESLTRWKYQVSTTDLDEPLGSELKATFFAVEPTIVARYSAWFDAMRDNAAAITLLLDIAERHLGKLQWHDGQLSAIDKRTSIELLAAQKSLADAERRYNETGRAALDSRDPTPQFIGAALQELEKTMHHRDGT